MKPSHLSTALTGLLLSAAAAAASLPIPPYQATYQVYGAGIPLGESLVELRDAGDGRYQMRSEVKPTGLASLLVAEQLNEQVSGRFRDGLPLPSRYEQQRNGSKGPSTQRATFDWEDRRVLTEADGQTARHALSARVVDPLSLHLLVMQDLKRGQLPGQYTLVDETELKTYRVNADGEDILDTPLGKLRTIKISRQKPGSNRVTRLWFAPDLDYLLVQIAQTKDGKEVLRMQIKGVEGIRIPR